MFLVSAEAKHVARRALGELGDEIRGAGEVERDFRSGVVLLELRAQFGERRLQRCRREHGDVAGDAVGVRRGAGGRRRVGPCDDEHPARSATTLSAAATPTIDFMTFLLVFR